MLAAPPRPSACGALWTPARGSPRSRAVLPPRATASPAAPTQVYPRRLLQWLSSNGAAPDRVTIETVVREGQEVDVTAASAPLAPGDVALRVPEALCVTLERVFDDDARLAELLATGKLSELALLTLFLMYEKKRGAESRWYPLIKELDRQAGRGSQGAKSPLLWDEGQAEALLAGSPVVGQIRARLAGIRKEFEALDDVYYLSPLFQSYPFEIPSEQFQIERFIQAFTAVQSAVVHLQGVPLSKRFALVPLGPPLLTYSSTAKALLKYNADAREVQLTVDRAYAPGDQIFAWCGPQPNARLLVNYGVVDDSNPFDKLPLMVQLPSDDPLYRQKRARLGEAELSTQQTFLLGGAGPDPLPPTLLPYLRLAYAATEEELGAVRFGDGAAPIGDANEARVVAQLSAVLQRRLAGYRTTIAEDDAVVADPAAGPRATVAARLLRAEKRCLQGALATVMARPGAAEAIATGAAAGSGGVKFV